MTIALLIALVVSLSLTYFLYTRMKHQFAKTASFHVVVSSSALEAGTQLTAEQLTLAEWPASVPLEGVVTKPETIVGRILLYAVPAKEPIREPMLAEVGSAVGLTAKIPEGMRAVAIVTNELNNVAGFLFPGSHVDVLLTLKAEASAQSLTATVLQNVEVLSTGEKLEPDSSSKPQNVKVVTLLLNPEDAQKLMLASNQGTIQLVLRNSADEAQVQSRPVDIRELIGNPPPAQKVAGAPRAAAPAKSPGFEVETFDGAKKSGVKF